MIVAFQRFSSVNFNHKTVPAPGEAQQLPDLGVGDGARLVIKPLPTNANLVYIGSTQAEAENHAKAYPLKVGDAPLVLYVDNASRLWVDALAGGDGVALAAEVEK